MESMLLLVAGLVAGAAVGAIAMWLLNRRKEAGGSVAKMKAENEKFREEVTEHFVETARLINQLTDSYKAVFDHLSGGAEKLVDQEKLSERLPSVQGGEVRLYRIGASDAADEKSKAASAPEPERKPETRYDPKPRGASTPSAASSKPEGATASGSAASGSIAASESAKGGEVKSDSDKPDGSREDSSKAEAAKPDPAAPPSAATESKSGPSATRPERANQQGDSKSKNVKSNADSEPKEKKDSGAKAGKSSTNKADAGKDPLKKS